MMRKRKTNISISFLTVLFTVSVACMMLTSCRYIKLSGPSSPAKEKKQTIDHYKDPLSAIKGPYDGTEDSDWLQSVVKTAEVMTGNQFTYDRKGIAKTLDKALKGNRHADCAHLISWALQDYGVLDTGENFYSDSSGSLSCGKDSSVYTHLEERCEIIDVGDISCSETEKLKEILHVGDICCYNKHMNVVAGINAKGNILYYDAGLVPTKKKSGKIYYTEKLNSPFARKSPTFKRYKLYTIIRIK